MHGICRITFQSTAETGIPSSRRFAVRKHAIGRLIAMTLKGDDFVFVIVVD